MEDESVVLVKEEPVKPKSNFLHVMGLKQKTIQREKFTKEPAMSKSKVFVKKWLEMDVMKDWLAPNNNPLKAECSVCNKVLNAGKSELIKHASGLKHAKKLGNVKMTKSQNQEALDLITDSLKIGAEPFGEIVDDEEQSMACRAEASTSYAETYGKETDKKDEATYQKKHFELLSRIASAVERIASSQETLVKFKSRKHK